MKELGNVFGWSLNFGKSLLVCKGTIKKRNKAKYLGIFRLIRFDFCKKTVLMYQNGVKSLTA